MAELTLESSCVCEQLVPYKTEWKVGGYRQYVDHFHELVCDCPGFHYRKRCKHVAEIDRCRCTWSQQGSGGDVTVDGRCPECGGPVIHVMVGV